MVTSSAFCTVSSSGLAGSPIAVSLRLFSSSMSVPPDDHSIQPRRCSLARIAHHALLSRGQIARGMLFAL
jgi:hypothetical protein